MKRPVYYYDFEVGEPKSNYKTWRKQQLKIAAHNPNFALYAKYLMLFDNIKRTPRRKIVIDHDSIIYSMSLSVRRIIEYKLVEKAGNTKYRFKKVAEYKISKSLKIEQIGSNN